MTATSRPPRVSVATAWYNRREPIAESIGSLLRQSHEPLEIVVVDDGSTDGTGEALEALSDPRLRLVRQQNTGFPRAIDRAVREGTGEFVAIHDAGDVSFPERIARQAAYLAANPDVAVVGCWVEDQDTHDGATRLHRPTETWFTRDRLLRKNPYTHGEVMFRRDAYVRAGGYRPFFRLAEDRDMWLRMSRQGRLACVPEVLYRRRKFPGGVSTTASKQILEAYFADFAVQCATNLDAQGRDWIDRHGDLAGFLRRRSRRLARRLGVNALYWLLHGKDADARTFLEAAKREYRDSRVLAAEIVVATKAIPWVWHTVTAPWLRRRFAG